MLRLQLYLHLSCVSMGHLGFKGQGLVSAGNKTQLGVSLMRWATNPRLPCDAYLTRVTSFSEAVERCWFA